MFVALVWMFMCSVSVMMNMRTRRLSKIPQEVRAEIDPLFIEKVAVKEGEIKKLQKLNDSTADYIQGGWTVSLEFGI